MNPESQDFEQLRRLLALKRHEQPPPGYFNDFSSQIIGRIRAGDRGDESFGAESFWEVPWLQRFWAAMEARPVFAGGFAVAACGLLVAGFLYSEMPDTTGTNYSAPLAVAGPTLNADQKSGAQNPVLNAMALGNRELSSINPIPTSTGGGSLFDEIQKRSANSLQAQPVRASYNLGGGN